MHITRPYRPLDMCGRHSLVMMNAPRALMDWMRSNFFVGVSAMVCHQSALALLTRMSTRPNFATTALTHATQLFSSRRSSWNASAFAPSASTSAATVWIVPGRVGWGVADLAATTTAHPHRASARQVSRPTPREPPVTMATLPRRSGVDGTGMLSISRAEQE